MSSVLPAVKHHLSPHSCLLLLGRCCMGLEFLVLEAVFLGKIRQYMKSGIQMQDLTGDR